MGGRKLLEAACLSAKEGGSPTLVGVLPQHEQRVLSGGCNETQVQLPENSTLPFNALSPASSNFLKFGEKSWPHPVPAYPASKDTDSHWQRAWARERERSTHTQTHMCTKLQGINPEIQYTQGCLPTAMVKWIQSLWGWCSGTTGIFACDTGIPYSRPGCLLLIPIQHPATVPGKAVEVLEPLSLTQETRFQVPAFSLDMWGMNQQTEDSLSFSPLLSLFFK